MRRGLWIAAAGLVWLACAESPNRVTGVPPAGGFQTGPDAVVKVSGDGQRGRAGRTLADPLVIRVIDEFGNPVAGVRMHWTIDAEGASVSDDTTETDAGGVAETHLTLGPRLRNYTVDVGEAGSQSIELRAFFAATATVLPVRIEEFRFHAPRGGTEATVGTGDTVEWENTDTIAHAVRTERAPDGASAFESGRMEPGETFRFVPSSSGRWSYTCPLHPERSSGGALEVR